MSQNGVRLDKATDISSNWYCPSCIQTVLPLLVKITTCSPFRAHTGPLMYANKMLSVNSINTYLMEIFMYQCIYQEVPEILLNLLQTNDDVHDYNTRQSHQLHVPYGRLDVRRFSFEVHGNHVWNTIPDHIMFKQYILSSNCSVII